MKLSFFWPCHHYFDFSSVSWCQLKRIAAAVATKETQRNAGKINILLKRKLFLVKCWLVASPKYLSFQNFSRMNSIHLINLRLRRFKQPFRVTSPTLITLIIFKTTQIDNHQHQNEVYHFCIKFRISSLTFSVEIVPNLFLHQRAHKKFQLNR